MRATRDKYAALILATVLFTILVIGNAIDPPESGSIYKQEDALGYFFAIAQALPLLFVLRWPIPAFTTIMASFTVHTGLGHETIWVVQFTALLSFFIAVTQGGDRQSILALIIANAGAIVAFGIVGKNPQFGNVVMQVMLFGGLWIVANLFRTGRLSLESAKQVVVELEADQARLAREAVNSERVRIARELHDVLGHTLNLVVIQAGAAQRVYESSPEKALEAVKSIESTSRQALSDVDRMLGILRDPDEPANTAPSLEARPSLSRINKLVSELASTGQTIEFTISGHESKLAASTDLTAYRVVQEALTNVMTHAAGSKARVDIDYGDNQLEVSVTNDGSGIDKLADRKSGGRGIVGMRERTSLFGGKFEAGSTDDGGWRVNATFPLNRNNTVDESGDSE